MRWGGFPGYIQSSAGISQRKQRIVGASDVVARFSTTCFLGKMICTSCRTSWRDGCTGSGRGATVGWWREVWIMKCERSLAVFWSLTPTCDLSVLSCVEENS